MKGEAFIYISRLIFSNSGIFWCAPCHQEIYGLGLHELLGWRWTRSDQELTTAIDLCVMASQNTYAAKAEINAGHLIDKSPSCHDVFVLGALDLGNYPTPNIGGLFQVFN